LSPPKVAAPFMIICAALFGAAACDSRGSGSTPSAENQIRQAVADYTQAMNAGDADRVNALMCKDIRAARPATAQELKESLATYGTYTTQVATISVTGDRANVDVTIKNSKDSGPPGHMKLLYVLEDGSWKRCSD
jgi:ketosteroid isomerase-like protein